MRNFVAQRSYNDIRVFTHAALVGNATTGRSGRESCPLHKRAPSIDFLEDGLRHCKPIVTAFELCKQKRWIIVRIDRQSLEPKRIVTVLHPPQLRSHTTVIVGLNQ